MGGVEGSGVGMGDGGEGWGGVMGKGSGEVVG